MTTRIVRAFFGVVLLLLAVMLVIAGLSNIYACTQLYGSQANLPSDAFASATGRGVLGFVITAFGYGIFKWGRKFMEKSA